MVYRYARESEVKLRKGVEAELSAKTVELSNTQAKIEALGIERAELESSHLQKIGLLELKLKELEEGSRFMTDQLERLGKEKEQLTLDNLKNQKKISTLTKKIHKIELERIELQSQLKKFSGGSSSLGDPAASANAALRKYNDSVASAAGEFAEKPAIDPVKLGQIVVQKSSGYAARVEHVNPLYGFIVFNAGTIDGLKQGSVVNVVRDKRLIGRAVVEQARDKSSAATLLPEWTTEKVEAGDFISKL